MHYRNGREAKNGDKVVQLTAARADAVGILVDAVADGGSHCNGRIVVFVPYLNEAYLVTACLCDCLHVDDVAALLAEKGLDKRPDGM